jgi:uncharacterized protein (DUF697 family)
VYNAAGDEISANFVQNGAVTLYHDGAAKLATTATGIDVTGTATMDGLTISSTENVSFTQTHTDGNVVTFTQSGTGGDIDWRNANGAALIRTADASRLLVASNGDVSFYEDTGTTPKFVWSSSAENLTLSGTGGLTVSKTDGSIVKLESTGTGLGAGAVIGDLQFYGNDASTPGAGIKASITATTVAALGDDSQLMFSTSDGTTNNVNRMLIANNGDVSFYEDTGTTPKFVWSSSAESLGLNNINPSATYSVDAAKGIRVSAAAPSFTLQETDAANQSWLMASYGGIFAIRDTTVAGSTYPLQIEAATPSNTLYLDSTGNVGIRTGSPEAQLHIYQPSGQTGFYVTRSSTIAGGPAVGITTDSSKARIYGYGDALSFWTASTGGSAAERLRIDASGNVGIGTSTPAQAKLDILLESDYSSHTGHGLSILSNAADAYTSLYIGTDDTIDSAYIQSAGKNTSFTSKKLLLNPNGGNVGIGTSSPSGNLEIATSASDTGVDLVLDGNKTSNGGIGSIIFNNNGDSVGMIRSNRASADDAADMLFYTQATGGSNTERARLTSDGNFLVGTTNTAPATNNVAGIVLRSEGHINVSRDNGVVGYFNRKTSDGTVLDIRKDGTNVGSIGVVGGSVYIDGGSSNYSVMLASDFRPRTSNGAANNDAAVDLGDSSARWKDLYISGGVYLGGTGAANLLDDYESGTWTPVFADAVTAGNTATMTADGRYTKIGRLITVECRMLDIDTTGMTAGNNIFIRGLPEVVSVNSRAIGSVSLDRVNFTNYVVVIGGANTSYALLSDQIDSDQDVVLTVAAITSTGSDITFTLQYTI